MLIGTSVLVFLFSNSSTNWPRVTTLSVANSFSTRNPSLLMVIFGSVHSKLLTMFKFRGRFDAAEQRRVKEKADLMMHQIHSARILPRRGCPKMASNTLVFPTPSFPIRTTSGTCQDRSVFKLHTIRGCTTVWRTYSRVELLRLWNDSYT